MLPSYSPTALEEICMEEWAKIPATVCEKLVKTYLLTFDLWQASHLFKLENLHNWWLTKYFFAPLSLCVCVCVCLSISLSLSLWTKASVRGTCWTVIVEWFCAIHPPSDLQIHKFTFKDIHRTNGSH